MSSLKNTEKRYLEKLLDMGQGYVLNFTNRTYEDFFRSNGIDIYGPKYETHGHSKANKMRPFWEEESDAIVGKVLNEMMDLYQTDCELEGADIDHALLAKGREIVGRLLGQQSQESQSQTEEGTVAKLGE